MGQAELEAIWGDALAKAGLGPGQVILLGLPGQPPVAGGELAKWFFPREELVWEQEFR